MTEDLDWAKYAPSAKDKVAMAHRENLAVGEPWTFIAKDDEQAVAYAARAVGERISTWWNTGEPGRLFLITRVHERSLETTFLGFQCMPGSFVTVAEFDASQDADTIPEGVVL